VVQVASDVTTATGYGSGTAEKRSWVDVATLKVKPKTPRRKVVLQALNEAGIAPSEETLHVRVLDADSAAEMPVEPYRPPAEWKVNS
jgi:hypothetical protein